MSTMIRLTAAAAIAAALTATVVTASGHTPAHAAALGAECYAGPSAGVPTSSVDSGTETLTGIDQSFDPGATVGYTLAADGTVTIVAPAAMVDCYGGGNAGWAVTWEWQPTFAPPASAFAGYVHAGPAAFTGVAGPRPTYDGVTFAAGDPAEHPGEVLAVQVLVVPVAEQVTGGEFVASTIAYLPSQLMEATSSITAEVTSGGTWFELAPASQCSDVAWDEAAGTLTASITTTISTVGQPLQVIGSNGIVQAAVTAVGQVPASGAPALTATTAFAAPGTHTVTVTGLPDPAAGEVLHVDIAMSVIMELSGVPFADAQLVACGPLAGTDPPAHGNIQTAAPVCDDGDPFSGRPVQVVDGDGLVIAVGVAGDLLTDVEVGEWSVHVADGDGGWLPAVTVTVAAGQTVSVAAQEDASPSCVVIETTTTTVEETTTTTVPAGGALCDITVTVLDVDGLPVTSGAVAVGTHGIPGAVMADPVGADGWQLPLRTSIDSGYYGARFVDVWHGTLASPFDSQVIPDSEIVTVDRLGPCDVIVHLTGSGTPTTTIDHGSGPVTGSNSGPLLAAGALCAAGGSGLILVARRRRTA